MQLLVADGCGQFNRPSQARAKTLWIAACSSQSMVESEVLLLQRIQCGGTSSGTTGGARPWRPFHPADREGGAADEIPDPSNLEMVFTVNGENPPEGFHVLPVA